MSTDRYELTDGSDVCEDAVRSSFQTLSDTPFGDEQLSYSITLPNYWGYEKLTCDFRGLPTNGLTPLAIFAGPGSLVSHTYFQIQGMCLLREISAGNWLRDYVHRRHGKTLKSKQLSEIFADCISEQSIDGTTFTLRQAARIDGDRLFLLQGLCPSEIYSRHKSELGLAIASFHLKNELGGFVERRCQWQIDGDVRFQLPESWYGAEEEEPGAVNVCLTRDENQIESWLRVRTHQSTTKDGSSSPESVIHVVKQQFESSNVVFDRKIHQRKIESVHNGIGDGHDFLFDCHIVGGGRVECRMLFVELGRKILSLGMICPSRNNDLYSWAVSQRGFDIACQTLDE